MYILYQYYQPSHGRISSIQGCFFLFTGAAPLSAPAFSLVFPLLKTVMIETPHNSEDKEEFLVKILQILTVHAQLRSSGNGQSLLVDEVRAVGSDDLQMSHGIKQLMCKLDKADEFSKLEFDWDFLRSVIHRLGT